jgi:hypothetical protein
MVVSRFCIFLSELLLCYIFWLLADKNTKILSKEKLEISFLKKKKIFEKMSTNSDDQETTMQLVMIEYSENSEIDLQARLWNQFIRPDYDE